MFSAKKRLQTYLQHIFKRFSRLLCDIGTRTDVKTEESVSRRTFLNTYHPPWTPVCMPSFVTNPLVHKLLVRHMLLTISPSRPFNLHTTMHSAAELDARYTREWRGHPSWNPLRALEKRSQVQRRAFEPVSALWIGQEERGQAGHIKFFCANSINPDDLSGPEHRRFFERCLEGIRASKEHICFYMQLFLRCILMRSVSVARGQLIWPHSASSRKVQEHWPLFKDCKSGLYFETSQIRLLSLDASRLYLRLMTNKAAF